jgi:VanZ family protein
MSSSRPGAKFSTYPQGSRVSTPRTKPDPRGPRFWLRAWWPVAVGIAVIAVESTKYFGADHTSGPLRRIFQALFGPVNDASWGTIHLMIRKSGHFLGYGALGVAWLRAWWMTMPLARFMFDAELALLGTALVATCDEWHQSFLPNRTSSPLDVLLDCCGALCMQWVVYIYVRLFRRGVLSHRS